MKRILITMLMVLSLLLVAPTAVSAASGVIVESTTEDEGEWEGTTWKVEMFPGEVKSTTITLYNTSSTSLDVEVSIQHDSLDNGNLTFGLSEPTTFEMRGKSRTNVLLVVSASGSTTPGTYTAELVIKSEIPPTPSKRDRDTGEPLYPIYTNLFGVEHTYYTEHDGLTDREIDGTSQDGNLTVVIPRGTTALDARGRRLGTLDITVDETPPDPPEDTTIIGLPYNFSPPGATFDPPITLTWSYDPATLAEEDLVLAFYDEDAGEWITLDCVVDTESNTITASVSHFTTFAIIGVVVVPSVAPPAPTPAPAPPVVPTPEPTLEPAPTPTPTPPVLTPPEEIPPTPINWPVLGGIIGIAAIGLLVSFLVWRKKRALKVEH